MKRVFLAFGLLCLLGLLVCGSAAAVGVYVGPHYVTDEVHGITNTSGGSGALWHPTSGTAGFYDSLYVFCRNGADYTKLDTTAWFSTKDIAPSLYQNDVTLAKDTTAVLVFFLSPVGSCNADSITVTIQAATPGGTVFTTSPKAAAVALASGTGMFVQPFNVTTEARLKYPLVRLIVGATGNDIGYFQCFVRYLSAKSD